MARMTKKLVKQIWEWTNACWVESCEQYYGNSDRFTTDGRYMHPDDKEAIDRDYRNRLCRLPATKLELVIEAHKKKRIQRAQVTIDAILTELLERRLKKV